MTPPPTRPDVLVQAAAEALQDDDAWYELNQQTGEVMGVALTTMATVALRAAFAKLPECEEAVIEAHENHYGSQPDDLLDHQQLRYVLAALAREFGGQE